jgi:predicted dehydrogenase
MTPDLAAQDAPRQRNQTVRVGIIGTGGIAHGVHIPGLRLIPDVHITAMCDTDSGLLEERATEHGVEHRFTDFREMVASDTVDAVVITTPNKYHAPAAIAAARAGKHVICEKPIALNFPQALEMYREARDAGIVHMTAFTYRFVPAMRYLRHLVVDEGAIGQPLHFRANRFQDWGDRWLAWRQYKELAGSGELGDMGAHRIDYGHMLIGPIARVVGWTKLFVPNRVAADGIPRPPADVEDWAAFMAEFENGVTGVFEFTKLASGRQSGGQGLDYVEINGTAGSVVFRLNTPHQIEIGSRGGAMEVRHLTEDWLKVAGSPRDPQVGDPLTVFRYDQSFEWISAIREGRQAVPSFYEGAQCLAVMDAVLASSESRQWVDVPRIER